MKIFDRIIAALTLVSMSLPALAYTVDTDKYFAYVEKPGRYQGGLSIPGSLLLLSQHECSAQGAPKSAKVGAIISLMGRGLTQEASACWYTEELHGQKIIVLCTTYGNKMDGGSAACEFVSPSRFLDANSLPRAADL